MSRYKCVFSLNKKPISCDSLVAFDYENSVVPILNLHCPNHKGTTTVYHICIVLHHKASLHAEAADPLRAV